MYRHSAYLILSFTFLIICTPPIRAEKTLEATIGNSWRYSHATQHGSRGFFGLYDVDNSGQEDYAPLNGWLGSNMSSGTDAGYSVLNTTIKAYLSVNEAAEIAGLYSIGPYITDTRPGPRASISTGNWSIMRVWAKTPLGRFYYGKTFFGDVKGIQYDSSRHTEELFMLQWSFKGCAEDWQGFEVTCTNGETKTLGECGDPPQSSSANTYNSTPYTSFVTGSKELRPNLNIWLGFYPWRRGRSYFSHGSDPTGSGTIRWTTPTINYWDDSDLNGARAFNVMGYVELIGSCWESTLLNIWSSYREGPESQELDILRDDFPANDTQIYEGNVDFRYNNGRFLFDTELAWYYRTVRYQRSATGNFYYAPNAANVMAVLPDNIDGSGSRFAPDYVESLRFKTEMGFIWGPWFLQLLYGRMPGPDRRHGIRIDRQPFVQEFRYGAPNLYGTYSSILANTFSGGVGGFGGIPDASSYGAKLDYRAAANLNIYTSFLTARRLSHGYGWGYIRPTTNDDTAEAAARGATPSRFGTVSYGVRGSYASPAPAIPDNNLGWELGAGFTWRLLEKWTLSGNFAYWQPGKWFNYACIDKSVLDWDSPTPANLFGINPNRVIDPVSSAVITLRSTF